MSQTSKRFTPAQKAEIVRRHVSGKEPISDLADQFGAQPSQIHNWVRQVLEQAERAFQVGPGRPPNLDNIKERKIEQLEARLAHKNEVIADLMEEHVKLKKGLGEL
jgi:transposase-like protein